MTTDNWQQFKEVFQAALELPKEERQAYLEKVSPDAASRSELEALLFCYEPADGGSGEIIEDRDKMPVAPADPLAETFMDHYQILERRGQTGIATQYLALRLNDPGLKQVIVTIVQTDMSPADFFRPFQRERIILISLRHPNIGAFLDTGITREGLPYWAVEFVEGVPVDEYCDSNKLGTHARIALIMSVCDAIQYAHCRFIAHGRITPRRILVRKDGVPKLLGLGMMNLPVHELTAPDAKQNAVEYASPEQLRGQPSTAADDVYALGVVLYQLLTGQSPYCLKGGQGNDFLPEIFEAIKPSKVLDQKTEQTRNEEFRTTRRLLAGDLDSIVLKAIQKNPAKRYASVEQFSGDLRRYFACQPVSTRDNTFLYRAGKFIQRRRKSQTDPFSNRRVPS
ncbi:MAG: serine/threonine protein kinase [Terriglobales bacterium]